MSKQVASVESRLTVMVVRKSVAGSGLSVVVLYMVSILQTDEDCIVLYV